MVTFFNNQDWFTVPDSDRASEWRKLRSDIKGTDIEYAMATVAKFFETAPISKCRFDLYLPGDFPDPWEIIFNNEFSQSSVSLMMYYSLSMAGIENVKLIIVNEIVDEYLLVLVDDRYVLNFELDTIIDFDEVLEQVEVIETYTKDDIKEIN